MTYTVTAVYRDGTTEELGTFDDKAKAMQEAKYAAHAQSDCVRYGPTSLAYIGRDTTGVVSWK